MMNGLIIVTLWDHSIPSSKQICPQTVKIGTFVSFLGAAYDPGTLAKLNGGSTTRKYPPIRGGLLTKN